MRMGMEEVEGEKEGRESMKMKMRERVKQVT